MAEAERQNESETLPREFGKYHLVEKIASGGMAELYRAKLFGAGGFEKDLAIKKVLPHLARDEAFIKMFMDEAMITATLNHGNIVSVIDFGQVNGEYFLVMEYIDGVDVQSLIRKSQELGDPFPAPVACYIAIEACKGLDYAHRKVGPDGRSLEIVHRDISPQNILISFEGEVKIVDFGIARAASRITSTQAGIVKGKLAYMAPEQISGGTVDRRADIYALGVSLYEMLTLRRPFEGATPQEILAAITRGDYEPVHKINRKVDRKLSSIVSRALEQNVKHRYQTAGEMAAELSAYLHRAGVFPDAITLGAFISQRLPEARRRTSPPTPVRAVRSEVRPPTKTDMMTAGGPQEQTPAQPPQEPPEAVSFEELGLGSFVPEPADSKRPTQPEQPIASQEEILRAKTILLATEEKNVAQGDTLAENSPAPTVNSELAKAKTLLLDSIPEQTSSPQEPQTSPPSTDSEVIAAAWMKQSSSTEVLQAGKALAPKLILIAAAVLVVVAAVAAFFLFRRSGEPQQPIVLPEIATREEVAAGSPEPSSTAAQKLEPPKEAASGTEVSSLADVRPSSELSASASPTQEQAGTEAHRELPQISSAKSEPPPTEKQRKVSKLAASKAPLAKNNLVAVKESSGSTRSPKGSGILRINSEPFAIIFLNGKSLGPTPQLNLKLPAGSHTLVLRNDALKLEKKVRVLIEPDKVHTLFVELGKP